jgi:hypothetical protein
VVRSMRMNSSSSATSTAGRGSACAMSANDDGFDDFGHG